MTITRTIAAGVEMKIELTPHEMREACLLEQLRQDISDVKAYLEINGIVRSDAAPSKLNHVAQIIAKMMRDTLERDDDRYASARDTAIDAVMAKFPSLKKENENEA